MKKGMVRSLSILTLVSVAITGCSSGAPAANKAAEPAKKADAPAAGAAAPASKGPVKVSVFVSGSGVPTPDKDPILQELNKVLNMDLEFNVATSDYTQQLNVKVAGGTPPDIFEVAKIQLEELSKQGLLLDLAPYIDKMPNVKKTFTAEDLTKGKVNGKQYSLLKRGLQQQNALWVRKDWLDKLGLKEPKTLDELKEMLVAFTEKDPDGNGKKDTFGLTGTGDFTSLNAFSPIFAAFGVPVPGNFTIDNGKVNYSTTDPRTTEAIKYIVELIKLGVVDPELMANKGLKDQQKAFQGQAGAIYRAWGELAKDNYVADYKKINPNADWQPVGALTGPGGTFSGFYDQGNVFGRIALPKSLEKKPEVLNKVLEYLDYITEPGKGQTLVNYGIEGKHYEMVNGQMKLLPAISETAYAFQVQLTGRTEGPYLKTKFPNQAKYIDFAYNLPVLKTYNGLIPNPPGVVVDDKNRFEQEEVIKFMYGKRPIAEYVQFVDTMNKTYQLPLYLQEADKALKALGYLK
ncbi:extracellular solute-binding protein [Paenibacillus sp. WQ 127069]|uniref:Extracellular solute-binding protein n=1 Tax=Paenibacillus baimaensis TaxID=2982185 RepID=A0ABT2UD23_9BACL|nr:extracellular solute-binding protein [Paenibacillus sp. WQ 127069]MCU6792543.1 extracellular solute-binding protein [Paenibacillus sp. WQ 127069]